MVRLVIFSSVIFLFNSCIRTNEHGYSRVSPSKFDITPNTDNSIYSIIDTNSVYRLVKKEFINATGMQECGYYKFYSNGKVGYYYCFEEDFIKTNILDPKKGHMGYYYFDGKKIIAQFHYNPWHGSRIQTDSIEIRKDSLIKIHRGVENSEIKSFYIKKSIPKNVKRIEPDW